MPVPMKALRAFPYAGKRLKAGEEFNARGESDARVLVAVGHAERCGSYQTRAIAFSPEQAVMRPKAFYVGDGFEQSLEMMDKEALHALAAERGVKVHHLAGAAKVRAAILAAE